MNYLSSLLTLSAIYLAVLASPGPNFFILSQLSLEGRRKEARWAVMGLTTGSLLWVTLSLLGLSALFASHPLVASVVRIAGAVYLVWYGVGLLRRALAPPPTAGRAQASTLEVRSPVRAYRAGLMTGVTNPKGAAFWTSAFATLLPDSPPLWFLAVTVLLVSVLSLGWHLGITVVFGLPRLREQYLKFERAINGIAGGALVLLGLQRVTR